MRDFRKMHGLGNDFVIVDHRADGLIPHPTAIRRLTDRRRGVGCDQLVVLLPPTLPGAEIFIRFFNPDASEAGACGNATRCIAHMLLAETGQKCGVVQTIAGVLPVWRDGLHNGVSYYAVDMGKPVFTWDKIPLVGVQDTLRLDLDIGPLTAPTAVNVGNPHAVFFVDQVAAIDLEKWGAQVEQHPLFPQRTNVEICQVISRTKLRMRVWERGAGITEACGSGACATLVAAVRRGLTDRKATVVLDGGVLVIEWRVDDHVVLSGPVATSFTGQLAEDFFTVS
ncbi:MAG: diaminopimelate epimerase [Alphaproteobacteria bacterium]